MAKVGQIQLPGCSTCNKPFQAVTLIINGLNYCFDCEMAGKWKPKGK